MLKTGLSPGQWKFKLKKFRLYFSLCHYALGALLPMAGQGVKVLKLVTLPLSLIIIMLCWGPFESLAATRVYWISYVVLGSGIFPVFSFFFLEGGGFWEVVVWEAMQCGRRMVATGA